MWGKRSVAEPSYRKRVGYQGGLVGGVALIASALLVMGNISTKSVIQQRLDEDIQAMLGEVVPARLHDNNLLNDIISVGDKKVYQAKQDGKVTAIAYEVSGEGYSGLITLIMALNAKGEILGVRVVSHTETPGLGDKIEEKRSPWVHSFENLSFDNLKESLWGVKKDGGHFDQFSGATITPRAVVKAIRGGMEFFRQEKDVLLGNASATPVKANAEES